MYIIEILSALSGLVAGVLGMGVVLAKDKEKKAQLLSVIDALDTANQDIAEVAERYNLAKAAQEIRKKLINR